MSAIPETSPAQSARPATEVGSSDAGESLPPLRCVRIVKADDLDHRATALDALERLTASVGR